MGGKKSQIIGGKIQAGDAVVCNTLGNDIGTKTEVFVGLPPELAERRKELQDSIGKHKENLKTLEADLSFLKRQEQSGTMNEKQRSLVLIATKSKFQLLSSLMSMEDELHNIEKRLELTKPKGVVKVKDICYPGVSITMRGFTYVVKESFKYAAFVYDEGTAEIKVRSFDEA
jgi:uncharacterized protein (DUF342 family)